MPYHISQDGLKVLDEQGHLVPGGSHKSHADALAHEQALNIATRREEGKPVAPKEEKGLRLSNGEFDHQKFNENHDPKTGEFSSGDGSGDSSAGEGEPPQDHSGGKKESITTPMGNRLDFEADENGTMNVVLGVEMTGFPGGGYYATDSDGKTYRFDTPLGEMPRRFATPQKAIGAAVSHAFKQYRKQAGTSRRQKALPERQSSPVDEQDPLGYGGEAYRDAPKDEKAQVFIDPESGELLWNFEKGAPPYVDREQGDLLADRAFYHHSPERYEYHPAMDWNDDTTPLPDAWVRAHPFGSPYQKDAHDEYFDDQTNFHDPLLPSVPVTYYHNYAPDGTPTGEPTAIGRTVARKYKPDGRWDKVHFDDGMDPEIKSRLAKALANGTLRSSPTVVPDFHEVDQDGHITHWLTGSIAVLDAQGERQPASPKAIGLPAMKALFQKARIPFPKTLEVKMGSKPAPRFTKARQLLKALMKALGEEEETPAGEALYHEHEDGTAHEHENGNLSHHHEGEDMKAVFEDSRPEESGAVPYGLGNTYWTTEYEGPQSERDRYDGGANFQKDVQGLAKVPPEGKPEPKENEVGDPDVRLDWTNTKKSMSQMKAQMAGLQKRADEADFMNWFNLQLQGGKVLPAEFEAVSQGYLQALADDRRAHPVMKAKDGKTVSRLQLFTGVIEGRESRFGPQHLSVDQMKALGYQAGGFDTTAKEQEWNDKRREELLNLSPLGAKILSEKKR